MSGGIVFSLMLVTAAAPVGEQPDPVSAFACKAGRQARTRGLQTVVEAYHRHSVTILKAALAGDVNRLRDMVDPATKFTILSSDDNAIDWRETGASAAVTFARGIGPTGYQFSIAPSGLGLADPCGETSAELMLIGRPPNETLVVTFRYRRGMLVDVVARNVDMTRGDFASAADR
jgi:hypothetical protein